MDSMSFHPIQPLRFRPSAGPLQSRSKPVTLNLGWANPTRSVPLLPLRPLRNRHGILWLPFPDLDYRRGTFNERSLKPTP